MRSLLYLASAWCFGVALAALAFGRWHDLKFSAALGALFFLLALIAPTRRMS